MQFEVKKHLFDLREYLDEEVFPMRRLIVVTFFAYLLYVSSVFAQQDSMLVEGFESLDGWKTGGQKL